MPVIMAIAGWGFLAQQVGLLLACVALMGLHSTLFGSVKFAYLPQHLDAHELTGGNGLVEMGTFVAILLGNVAGGLARPLGLVLLAHRWWPRDGHAAASGSVQPGRPGGR